MSAPAPSTVIESIGVVGAGAWGTALAAAAAGVGARLVAPPLELCGDNGVMVAWAGAERLALGLVDSLDAPVRARWPLDASAAPRLGSGRLGAKA